MEENPNACNPEVEKQDPKKLKRMTLFAIYFSILAAVTVYFLPADKAEKLFVFFKDIILHLVIG